MEVLLDIVSRIQHSDVEQADQRHKEAAAARCALRMASNTQTLNISELMKKISADETPQTDSEVTMKVIAGEPNVTKPRVEGVAAFPPPPTGPTSSSKPGA